MVKMSENRIKQWPKKGKTCTYRVRISSTTMRVNGWVAMVLLLRVVEGVVVRGKGEKEQLRTAERTEMA